MKNVIKTLLEAAEQAKITDQQRLLNFIRSKIAEFEAAQNDVAVIEAILDAAVEAKAITDEDKLLLLTAFKGFAEADTQSNQSLSELDAKEPAQGAGEDAEQPVSVPEQIKSGIVYTEPVARDAGWTSSGAAAFMDVSTYTVITTGGWLWLLILYLGATWLAVGSLSSIQFRSDIEPKYKVTLNKILEVLEKKDLQLKIDQYRDIKLAETLDWDNHLKDIVMALDKQPESLNSLLDVMGNMRCDSPETIASCKQLSKVLNSYLPYLKKKQSNEDDLQKTIETYEKNCKTQDGLLLPTHEETPATGENASKAENKLDDLQAGIGFMLKFHYGDFLKMPVQVLTLLLAIAMGVLGSTITMTWSFLDEKTNLPLRWYLLRPFVGALSALVIFIFAKAGQMSLITDAANSTLSPFLLSLLGIAAGLLSDRAYAQMSSVSGKFLGNMGVEQERWASHLDQELQKQNMTSEALATTLNLDKRRTDEIITGVRTATLKEQQRISDRLGIAPRLLFTDIAP